MTKVMQFSVVLTVLAGLACVPASALLIVVDPTVQTVVEGSLFSVDLLADTETDNSLYAWSLDVSWDPSVITLNNIVEGGFLASGGQSTQLLVSSFGAGFIDNLTGTIVGAVPGVQGVGVVATLWFEATGLPGMATSIGLDPFQAIDDLGELKPFEVQGGRVNLVAVPEPATMLLVGAGAGLMALRRRRQAKTA